MIAGVVQIVDVVLVIVIAGRARRFPVRVRVAGRYRALTHLGEPGAEDLDGDLDDDPDDDVLDDEYLDDEPESTASGTRPARDVLGGTSAAGEHGAGYSPA